MNLNPARRLIGTTPPRHILVDGQRVDRPSFRVKPGQLIHVHAKGEGMEPFQVAAAGGHADVLPKTPRGASTARCGAPLGSGPMCQRMSLRRTTGSGSFAHHEGEPDHDSA